MLKKSFSLASVVSLTGAVVWMAATSACGGSEETPANTSSSGSGGDSGASSSGASSSGTASSSGASSSGSSSGDAGLVDPKDVPGVEIPYGKCEAFEKCDGSVEGNWAVTGGCLSDDTFDQFRKVPGCTDVKEHDVVIKASGTVSATADQITQKTSIFVSAKVDVPKTCPPPPFGSGSCDAIPGLLTSGFAGGAFDHATCTDGGDICNCAADVKVDEQGVPTAYKKDGTGVLTTQNPTRNFEYCPKGDMITYRETTKDAKSFGMLLQIKKQ